MQLLLAVLLYLNIIHPGGVYHSTQINTYESQNHNTILTVESHPAEMQLVNSIFLPQTPSIVVIQDEIQD